MNLLVELIYLKEKNKDLKLKIFKMDRKLYCYVLSKHKSVKTNVYELIASNKKDNNILPLKINSHLDLAKLKTKDDNVFIQDMINKSRKLLYDIYCRELEWDPNTNLPTQFVCDHKNKMLKDRFDDVAIWTCIVTNIGRSPNVIAILRNLSGYLKPDNTFLGPYDCPDLDITSYRTSSEDMRNVISKLGAGYVLEIQRFAINKNYRNIFLPAHLFYASIDIFHDSSQKIFSPDSICIGSAYNKTVEKYCKLCGGSIINGWSIIYDPNIDRSFFWCNKVTG